MGIHHILYNYTTMALQSKNQWKKNDEGRALHVHVRTQKTDGLWTLGKCVRKLTN